MDTDTYRQQLLREVDKARAETPPAVLPEEVQDYQAEAVRDAEGLIRRIGTLTLRPDKFELSVGTLLAIAQDRKLPVAVRLAALQRLSAAKFLTNLFEPLHPAYTEALRRLATDPSARVREAALERLTLTSDRFAQKLLRDSLGEDGKPLLRTQKAVQFLARDDHAAAKPLFRALAESGIGKVREEALRALASDPRSAAMFEAIASDKKERAPVREIAAAGLKAASPPRFAKLAQKLILDANDDDRVRAAAASAVAHTKGIWDRLAKPRFASAVTALGGTTKSRALRKSAKQLASRLRNSEG